ncbi:hypothetical protein AVEN_273020-1 [Araneus ventricosus]|uniref:Uncharacterized protein n=1 Tax=Araneus ventricosus TaxID=182803 RepID=A0A4Y2EYD7_ARAVE|nr:hypothetical protein AVEN_273020-1 [Araneus ventricosus]
MKKTTWIFILVEVGENERSTLSIGFLFKWRFLRRNSTFEKFVKRKAEQIWNTAGFSSQQSRAADVHARNPTKAVNESRVCCAGLPDQNVKIRPNLLKNKAKKGQI